LIYDYKKECEEIVLDDYTISFNGIRDGEPFNEVIFRPFAKQAVFLAQDGMIGLFGGAAGPGKTKTIYNQAVHLCMQHEEFSAILFRRKIDDIEDSIVNKLKLDYLNYWNLPGFMEYNESKRVLRFPRTRSTLKFDHLQRITDVQDHKSVEYDYIGFDELTMFEEEQFKFMFTRGRTRNNRKVLIRAGSNPDGLGNLWVKRFFVDKEFTKDEVEAFASNGMDINKEVFFVPAKLEDNPIINTPEYRTKLMLQSPEIVRAQLYGEWDLQAGRFFVEFNPEIHIIDPLTPEEVNGMVIVTGTDDGFDPSAHATLWGAKDNNGNIFIFNEHVAKKFYTDQNIQEIKERNRGLNIRAHVADSEMWTRDKKEVTSLSVAERYEKAGLKLEKATKSREIGWQLIRDLLRYDKRGGRFVVVPKLYITKNCVGLIHHLKSAVTDERYPNDIKKIFGHDTLDALRYLIMYLASDSIRNKKEKTFSEQASKVLWDVKRRFSMV
jgi:PBSX family phage terminase large subunit